MQTTLFEVVTEPPPDVLGLAGDRRVRHFLVLLGTQRSVAAARHGVITAGAIGLKQLTLATELHRHAADTHDVGIGLERNGLDILVDDLNVPVRR